MKYLNNKKTILSLEHEIYLGNCYCFQKDWNEKPTTNPITLKNLLTFFKILWDTLFTNKYDKPFGHE